jgi:hypothetical protein
MADTIDTANTTDEAGTDEAAALAATVEAYFGALNEADPARRAELVSAAWAEEGRYFDPLMEAAGHDAIANLTAVVQEQFPGARFARTSGIDAHHGILRFGWRLANPDGSVVVEGLDVGVVGDDHRLTRIAGFFGPLPAAA